MIFLFSAGGNHTDVLFDADVKYLEIAFNMDCKLSNSLFVCLFA